VSLNSPEGRDSEAGLKTFDNNSDAAHTGFWGSWTDAQFIRHKNPKFKPRRTALFPAAELRGIRA
ncbi:MAG: hypothetical protein Q7J27_10975, partial [Syntrophales bacterium]|nr:hypothetical protein [Syntrophales bacterium]